MCLDNVFVQFRQKDKRQNHNFCVSWFERNDWLANNECS